jgi:hypothetical protein
MQAPLLRHPIEEAASPSDREIDSNQKHAMSDHGKNLFIEQHKDVYAILRGDVNEPLAVEPTQDATIEKARKLEPDAASMWSGFATSERGGRDKCGGSDRHQAAPRFLGFFCARLSCRAATRSITLLRAGLGGGAWRLCPFALSSISFFSGIEFCRYALDKLQGKIDFVGEQLLVDRQSELVSSVDFRGETEGV